MKTLTVDLLKEMTSDPNCIKVVNALFEAHAFAETMRAIIEPQEQKVVDFYQFKIAEKFRNLDIYPDIPLIINSPSWLYMADEEDSKLFFKEMHKFHVENKLPKRSPDHCPLLEAESLVRDIKIQVCEFLQPYLDISYDEISWSLPAYKSYYDLIMTMFAPAVAEYQKTNPLPVR